MKLCLFIAAVTLLVLAADKSTSPKTTSFESSKQLNQLSDIEATSKDCW